MAYAPIVFGAIFGLFVLITILQGVVIVNQSSEYVIERFGKYSRTLSSGLHLIVPWINSVRAKVDMREQVLNVPRQSCITKDNVAIEIDGVAFFQIMDAQKSIYEVADYNQALENMVTTNLRNQIGCLELDEVLSQRSTMNASIAEIINEAAAPWGLRIPRVEIKDIKLPKELEDSISMQMRAERERRAKLLEADAERDSEVRVAEGNKKAAILNAEGQKQAAILTAEGESQSAILTAEGESKAKERMALAQKAELEAIEQGATHEVLEYKKALAYTEALAKLSASDNSKVVFMPSEMSAIGNAVAAIGAVSTAVKGDVQVDTQA